MNKCTYVRKAEGGYEYGHMVLHNSGEKSEKREHVAHGVKPTIEAALKANKMALKGASRIGGVFNGTPLWRDS